MSRITEIEFKNPEYKSFSRDSIDFYFPYFYRTIENRGEPNEIVKNLDYGITVGISGMLSSNWGFQALRDEKQIRELMKILFIYALSTIKEKYYENSLKENDEIILTTENQPSNCPYNPNNVKGIMRYKIQLDNVQESFSNKIIKNQIGDKIIQLRDNINAIYSEKYNSRLLLINEERNLLDFFRSANTYEEFMNRIASLANLIGKINIDSIKSLDEIKCNGNKTLDVLECYLVYVKAENYEEVIQFFRDIIKLRQSYPVHSDSSNGVVGAFKKLGIDYPISNFDDTWQMILQKYSVQLESLFKIIKEAIY